MKFKDSVSFIKSFLKEPKKIIFSAMIAGSIIVGSQKISAQSLQFIKPIELNPSIYKEGHVFSSKTYGFNADSSTTSFLEQAFEYRYGKKFKLDNQYNLGLEVGKNNLYINGKLIPDLTFARIYSTLHLSKILKTPIDIKLGYSREISNFVLKDIKPFDKTYFQASAYGNKIGTGVSLVVDGGKIRNIDGLIQLNFDNKYSAGLRYKDNFGSSKFLSIQGYAVFNDNKITFIPLAQIGLQHTQNNKKIPFVNYAFVLQPNNRLELVLHRSTSNNEKAGLYLEANYLLVKPKNRSKLKENNPLIKEKNVKEKLRNKDKEKDKINLVEKQENQSLKDNKKFKESLFKFFEKKSELKKIKEKKEYPIIKKPKRPR